MPDPALRRIAASGSHEIEIRKSRFICTVARVGSDEAAREAIAGLKKQYWDANHNCSAYIIGPDAMTQRSSDDGEPSGTAGVPMLEVLRKMRLTDTLAVVTRYFGGTLLGAGGLIRAYGRAVSETIREVGVVERRELTIVGVTVDHGTAGRLHNALAATAFPAAEVAWEADGARFRLHLEEADLARFRTWLAEATNGSAAAVIAGTQDIDVPVPVDDAPDA